MAMRRDWFLALFFAYAVVSELTHASLWDSRKLLDPAPKDNTTTTSAVILYFLEKSKRMKERILYLCIILSGFRFRLLGFPSDQSGFFSE